MQQAALRGLLHAVHQPPAARGVLLPVEHLQPPGDDHQKVVEVVSDAAGQLADGLDLLGLPQRLLHAGALRHLGAQLVVGGLELHGAGHHLGLQRLGRPGLLAQEVADLVLAHPCADRRPNRAGQGDGLHRPLEQRDVAQLGDQLLPPGRDGGLLLAAGQDHERQVRPRRLPLDLPGQRRDVRPEQAFLRQQHRRRALVHPFQQLGQRAAGLHRQPHPGEELH